MMYPRYPLPSLYPSTYHSYWQATPYGRPAYYDDNRIDSFYPYDPYRQQSVRGQATWTDGGQITQCGIPWSDNQYMTVSVGTNAPYRCGQTLKIQNLSSPNQKEILVKVVDQVPGYPANKINLHRRAFLALGSDPSVGIIDIEITPLPEVEQEEWGRYLLTITQAAYPHYRVTDYQFVSKSQESPARTKQMYEFTLQSPQETMKVQENVLYDPNTNRVLSFDLNEI
jgi:hypothetical protein